MSHFNIIELSRIANCRLTSYTDYARALPVDDAGLRRDTKAQELWDDYIHWLGIYAKRMADMTGTTETALFPLDRAMDKYLGM